MSIKSANHLAVALARSATTPCAGVWQTLPGANVSRILARSGAHFVVVDCEHGNIDDAAMHEAVPAIAAAGASPVVRIPDLHGWMVKRALDSGAHGIIVPLVRTAEEVRQVVAAAKFPPLGRRGFGCPFTSERFADPAAAGAAPGPFEYLQQANDALLTIVQIETREALAELDAIAAVPGVDVLFVGPFDLGISIGHPILDGVAPDELKATIGRILKAGKAAGRKVGIYATGGAEARTYVEMGFDMVSVAADAFAIQFAVAHALQAARG